MGVCTKERKGITAEVLMATPCTKSLGGESGGHKHEGDVGRRLCWKFAAVSGSGADGRRERRWFVLTRPRCDTNGESETEVTVTSKQHAHVTSKQHAQAEMMIMKSSRIRCRERRVGFIENTARRHRRGG